MGYEFLIWCHGRGHHRPDGITDKERGCESHFPKPQLETRSGEELATSVIGFGDAIQNPRRKPIFGVVGLMYKR
jgi:hypothetical protein